MTYIHIKMSLCYTVFSQVMLSYTHQETLILTQFMSYKDYAWED